MPGVRGLHELSARPDGRDGAAGRGAEPAPEWIETTEARAAYTRLAGLVEPVFGIIKEQLGARRFLLRGLRHVEAEWTVLATAFNLRTP